MKRALFTLWVVLFFWILSIVVPGLVLYSSATNFSVDKISRINLSLKTLSYSLFPFRIFPYTQEIHTGIVSLANLSSRATELLPVVTNIQLTSTEISPKDLEVLITSWQTIRRELDVLVSLANSDRGKTIIHKLGKDDQVSWWMGYYKQNEKYLPLADEVVTHLPYLLGMDSKRHYLVLFQNNMELRPTGGFMGSFGEIWLDKGKLSLQIQDIYVPDGQIKGYVEEPGPIRKYLFNNNHPGWRLRDANWHPDFPKATEAISWFMGEGGLDPFDGYVAINLFLISDMLHVTGPMNLIDYDLTVSPDNFYLEAQKHAEMGFFPGSTQKGDFLRTVGFSLLTYIQQQPKLLAKMLPILIKQLEEKHLMVYVPKAEMSLWQEKGYDGGLLQPRVDYLSINEANVGITKANCCIDRNLVDEITLSNDLITHNVTLTYVNHNPPKPEPPLKWGGGYKNYMRIMLPKTVTMEYIHVNGKLLPPNQVDIEEFDDHSAAGFLVLTEGGMSSEVTLKYSVPRTDPAVPYSMLFQKQSGVEVWPMKIRIREGDKKTDFVDFVRTDRTFNLQ